MNDLSQPRGPSVHRATVGHVHVVRVLRPDYEELYLSANAPAGTVDSARADAVALYREAADVLADRQATVVQERLFGSIAVQEAAEAGRAESLAGSDAFGDVPPTYLEGRPCCGDGLSGVHLHAIAGARIEPVKDDGQALGSLVRTPTERFVYLSGLSGTTPDEPMLAAEQGARMFDKANRLLQSLDLKYRDVVRTWIYLDDILAWYDEFNAVRNRSYTKFGLLGTGDDYLPASTGIQARSPGHIELTMDLLAIERAPGSSLRTSRLHNPLQEEADAYGSAFARAMEVVAGGVRTVYISGTASIDELGRSTHLGDIDGQIERTVRNIEALIGARGLTLDDICRATIFVKRPEHVERFQTLCAGTRFAELGVCMVADVCRADLLFEIDGIAARVT